MIAPHDDQLEAGLLGAILVTDTVLPAIVSVEGVKPESFHRPSFGDIFRAMVAIGDRGERVDVGTLRHELARAGVSDKSLGAIIEAGAQVSEWRDYARRVVELARMRERFHAGRALMEAAASRSPEAVAEAEVALASTSHETVRRRSREERQEAVLAVAEGRGTVWRTGFRKLDELLAGGLRPGQFTTVGGWASHGKSALATQLLSHVHGQGARCALYTNEMEGEELDLREIARDSGIAHWRLVQGQVRPDERELFSKAINRVGESFELIEAAGMSAEEIAYDIRRERWDVACVDLLNGLPGASETKDIDRNVATLAACSRQARCHVLACQHLNQARHVGRAYPPEPAPSDIRGSGAIYNLSNNVLFVYLHESDVEEGEPGDRATLRLAKARGGLRGRLDAVFQPKRMRFLPETTAGTVGSVAA